MLAVDIPGELQLLELSACGREVTKRVEDRALQKAAGLKWLRLHTWTMAKWDMPKVI